MRGLKVHSEEEMARYPDAPRPLREDEYLYLREMVAEGLVRDTIRRLPTGGGGSGGDSLEDQLLGRECERYCFRGWLSGLRPGIKPFVLRGGES